MRTYSSRGKLDAALRDKFMYVFTPEALDQLGEAEPEDIIELIYQLRKMGVLI
tara:strand:- start:512 stop:670 length:159 start_codon:yes stop_codon:yes gene_type:complete